MPEDPKLEEWEESVRQFQMDHMEAQTRAAQTTANAVVRIERYVRAFYRAALTWAFITLVLLLYGLVHFLSSN